ncbi:nucleoside deaminase [Candidatus Raskinella chloraquaticus]|uniref:tRNA-specific adenosine deaminase n=1 Tax=Candidatus Raskinella chloraquaticus TaxID=1951219 RepID=A0A1W9I582_9HYPH|nr:MAG: tRNA-specific adenosine deaminase [Proteobacteria bacterium SG_bin8]
MSLDDRTFLLRAVDLSRTRMLANAGGPFGALVVREGKVLAEGWNEVTSSNDPTAHAEVRAIRKACEAVSSFQLQGATLYSSCEPCPMCLAAAYWARVGRIVFAADRVDAAKVGFDDAYLYDEIPKPVAARALPTLHLPLQEAVDVFAAWHAKPDRVDY